MNNKLHEHLSEETLHAWLDDELSSRETASVDEHLDQCAECSALLEQSRELCTSVSQILSAYDGELASTPRVDRAKRPQLTLSSRVPSAPIISHIVAESQGRPLWPRAKRWAPIAAMILVFVGGASLTMVRGYHAVSNSVSEFAGDLPARGAPGVSMADTRVVRGTVEYLRSTPIRGVRVSVRGSKLTSTTNGRGEFSLSGVPREALTLDVGAAIGYESTSVTLNASSSRETNLRIELKPQLIRLNPVVITTAEPAAMSKIGKCLTPIATSAANGYPPFSKLRGRLNTPGTPQVDIVDWPAPGLTTSATFTLLVTGNLSGVAWNESKRISISLTREGQHWKGVAHETGGNGNANRSIDLQESSCVVR